MGTASSVNKNAVSNLDTMTKDKQNEKLYILCDNNGIILNMNSHVKTILKYKLEDIKYKFIGIFMNKFLSFLHKKFFIPKMKSAHGLEKSKILNRMQSFSTDRPLIIYDINDKPFYMNLKLIEMTKNELKETYKTYNMIEGLELDKDESYMMIKIDHYINKDNVSKIVDDDNINKLLINIIDNKLLYILSNNEQITPVFEQTKNNVVIINIDIMDSKEILMTKGEVVLIDINRRLYNDIIHIIKTYFYPYIYIYEISEDQFILIINACWTYNIPLFCCTIGLYFVQLLFEKTIKYVNINCGISYGKLHYGLIGNKIRLFGEPLILSSLIKEKSEVNKFAITKSFYHKLLIEFNMIDDELYSELDYTNYVELVKGFGNIDYYLVDNLLNRFKRAIA